MVASTSSDATALEGTLKRDAEISKLIKITYLILGEIAPTEQTQVLDELSGKIIDIDLSNEVSGVLIIVFTCLRTEENDKSDHVKYLAYKATIKGGEISIKSIVDKIKAERIQIDFLVATPIVESMTLFKAYFDEVRTGLTRFRVRAARKRTSDGRALPGDKNRDHTRYFYQYGLCTHHIPLLQGVTLAPERRTRVVRSLGPLTQAILVVDEDKYHTELSSALLNSISMLPMASEIVDCLKEAQNPEQVMGILKELGDILLITTARSTQLVCMPLLMVVMMWEQRSTMPDLQWSFSGSSMLKFYNLQIDAGMRIRIKTGGDAIKTQEIIFHAMFGTYLQDLTALSEITMHSSRWHQRKDLNDVFSKRAEKPSKVLAPIKFKYILKMDQSLLTKSLGRVDSLTACATSRPSFSGFRKRKFTNEFLIYLSIGNLAHSYSTDPIHLLYALRKTKDTLLKDQNKIKMLQAGTKGWETFIEGQWTECEFSPTEGNHKFYGS